MIYEWYSRELILFSPRVSSLLRQGEHVTTPFGFAIEADEEGGNETPPPIFDSTSKPFFLNIIKLNMVLHWRYYATSNLLRCSSQPCYRSSSAKVAVKSHKPLSPPELCVEGSLVIRSEERKALRQVPNHLLG